ncbi:hypothetical protein KNP414_02052 [Paenibacillus mucilaginosus KNP414]|uniref:Uncharacterized protein n=1 Tax=Paenibacillus mucilaginosus (strain KNP414) TaxID=1036673 RepID=F8FRQ6_PAEMK|nr:hypothetical protein KNP414_02052 [Paenibacillus mucilaginosus KNP414]
MTPKYLLHSPVGLNNRIAGWTALSVYSQKEASNMQISVFLVQKTGLQKSPMAASKRNVHFPLKRPPTQTGSSCPRQSAPCLFRSFLSHYVLSARGIIHVSL